jgi:misacylated tRNA(Ala) deacylase
MQALYLLDPYKKEFFSTVKSVHGKFVVLEETAFYPNSGGQPFDTGKMFCNEYEYNVVNVEKSDGQISHELDREGLHVGDEVKGIIDWDRRYLLMKYHTAAHILSTLIHEATGAQITGNQLGIEKSRVDFSLQEFDRNLMHSFESKVNTLILNALPIHFKILPREEAFKIPALLKLRKAFDESIQEIRIVEIDNFDIQACGGCHVHNTCEIGEVEIIDLENKGKDRRRIYFRIK